MSKVALTVAIAPYEHALDVLTGRVTVEGIDLNWIRVPEPQLRERFADFDVFEMALADYLAARAQGRESPVAIPVFLSRAFVQGAIWVSARAAKRSVAELTGAALRWAADDETVATYVRAWLKGQTRPLAMDGDWPLMDTAALFDSLATGRVDVAVSLARPPERHGEAIANAVAHLAEAERADYRATKVFPIVRVLCIRRALVEQHRWLPGCLTDGFERAKRNSLDRLIGAGMSRYPIPWINAYVMQTRAVFGDDFWPYRVDANRATLQAFLEARRDQAPLAVDDLFDPAFRP